jgi:hypothetical protein
MGVKRCQEFFTSTQIYMEIQQRSVVHAPANSARDQRVQDEIPHIEDPADQ